MQNMRNSYLHLNNFYKPLATINALYTYAKRLKKTKRKQVENRKESLNGEVKAFLNTKRMQRNRSKWVRLRDKDFASISWKSLRNLLIGAVLIILLLLGTYSGFSV
jgi:hypothetical protein